MGDILKVVRVRKKSQFDSLDILVSVEKKNKLFSTKYEVVWFPSGETSTKYEYDSEDLNSETFSGTLNSAPITLTKKELVDRLLKNSDSPYIKLKANAYKDKYSRIGPALSFVLSADKYLGIDELEEIITYGFNTSTWTEGDAFINETIKKKELEDKVKYEIIEDPFNKDNVPRIRSFGYDPYYLPNGAKVIVKWIEGDITNSVNKDLILGSGRKYSTNSGEELEESAIDRKNRNVFKKHAEIFSADDKEIFYLGENLKFTKELKWKEYVNVSDAVILSDVLDAWRAAIPGYSLPPGLTLEQQSVTYRRPSGIDYKSPFEVPPTAPLTDTSTGTASGTQSQEGQKIPIFYNIPQGKFQAKTDLPKIIAYIGEDAKRSDSFDFYEPESELDDEFSEDTFTGEEESELEYVPDAMLDLKLTREAEIETDYNNQTGSSGSDDVKLPGGGKVSGTLTVGYKKNVPSWGKVTKGMTDAQLLKAMVDYIEGGYYHPTTAYTKFSEKDRNTFAQSGETLWGIDRFAGQTESTELGKKFWAAVDKISGYGNSSGTGAPLVPYNSGSGSLKKSKSTEPIPYARATRTADWDINKYPKIAGALEHCKSPKPGSPGYDIMYNAFVQLAVGNLEKHTATYIGNHPVKDLIFKDTRWKFCWFRSTWNGPGFFQKYAKNIKSVYDSGVKDIEKLIIADLNYRASLNIPLITHDVVKMGQLLGIEPGSGGHA